MIRFATTRSSRRDLRGFRRPLRPCTSVFRVRTQEWRRRPGHLAEGQGLNRDVAPTPIRDGGPGKEHPSVGSRTDTIPA